MSGQGCQRIESFAAKDSSPLLRSGNAESRIATDACSLAIASIDVVREGSCSARSHLTPFGRPDTIHSQVNSFIALPHNHHMAVSSRSPVPSQPPIFHKYTHVNELRALEFMAAYPAVPTPAVQASTHLSGTGYADIIMDFVHGRTLKDAWPELNRTERTAVLTQLRRIVDAIRAVPKPLGVALGFIGSADGRGPVIDERIEPDAPFGPFASERGFNDYRVRRIHGRDPAVTFNEKEASEVHAVRERMKDTHRIVFTHGNLVPRNVMLDGARIVAIVDWSQAGWRPESWEYIKSVYAEDLEGWRGLVKDFMPTYDEEDEIDTEVILADGIS